MLPVASLSGEFVEPGGCGRVVCHDPLVSLQNIFSLALRREIPTDADLGIVAFAMAESREAGSGTVPLEKEEEFLGRQDGETVLRPSTGNSSAVRNGAPGEF